MQEISVKAKQKHIKKQLNIFNHTKIQHIIKTKAGNFCETKTKTTNNNKKTYQKNH